MTLTVDKLQYIFHRRRYNLRASFSLASILAVTYIAVGNVAGTCLVFGIRTLEAANIPVTNGAVRGIAMGAATFACVIHSTPRRVAPWLRNVFAETKVLIPLLSLVTFIYTQAREYAQPTRDLSALIAISSFGNIMVLTSIGLSGLTSKFLLPYSRAPVDQLDVLSFLEFLELFRSNVTPLDALVMHWTLTIVIIGVTSQVSPIDTYNFTMGLYSCIIISIFVFLITIGVTEL